MTTPTTESRSSFWGWVGYVVLTLLPLITGAGAALCFTFRGTLDEKDPWKGGLFWIGVVLAIFTLFLQLLKGIRERLAKQKADRLTAAAQAEALDAETALTVVQKKTLEQLVETIAEMPHMDPAGVEQQLKLVSKYAVDAVQSLLGERVRGVRANVFKLTPAKDGLVCVVSGYKPTPQPFLAGEAETVEALEFLNSGASILFYDDLSVEKPSDSGRRRSEYQTFFSLPIAAPQPGVGRSVYGMLTVDAPKAKVFTQIDKDSAEIVADIIATAFAIVVDKVENTTSRPAP